ncbi:hypothetical protein [Bradyrhizobium commune]|uniref:Uncharacterized protein n=1 Tax=Bradyrhizobium commune TaxID=83627 RepID=A0A7S9DBK3_9BRAD|nr:hypothetical protein [Bradyrhizobium commune]QPF94715.1 hypothetical protein IC761_16205 [Bradyrhizobium commune]
MAVAGTIALLSISLLAVDAVVDLNLSGFVKRLESTQASIVDVVGHYQLAFDVRARARGKAAPAQCAD